MAVSQVVSPGLAGRIALASPVLMDELENPAKLLVAGPQVCHCRSSSFLSSGIALNCADAGRLMDLSWFFLNDLSSSPGVTAAWIWLTAIVAPGLPRWEKRPWLTALGLAYAESG
jgi:hypothetical protein